jgi:membrane associated rhomboid family serine protease
MFDRITPIVRNLLIANVIIYLIGNALPDEIVIKTFAFFNPFLPNSPDPLSPLFKPWQFVSYMFLHGGNRHIFGNMFGLFMFGSMLETYMGSKRFFLYYLITGIGAAVLYTSINYFEMSQLDISSIEYESQVRIPMLGASGAIFGILGAFGFIFPNIEMNLLFFPFPLKAKYFVALYGIYELVVGASGLESGVAHFAHIGGLFTGLILLKFFGFGTHDRYR